MLRSARIQGTHLLPLPSVVAVLLLCLALPALPAMAAPLPSAADKAVRDKTHAEFRGALVPATPSIRSSQLHVESGALPICEDRRCGTAMTQDACEACSLYRQVMSPLHMEQIHYHGFLVEGGVALRATSQDPEVQGQLFAVAMARNEILQRVHEGEAINLCDPCRANAGSFMDVQFGVERIPEGVILSYTSSRDDLVALLQVMLLNGHDLPL